MLADNRIALNAGWDLEMLRLELKDLADLGRRPVDARLRRGGAGQALAPASTAGLTDEDDVPEVGERRSVAPATSGALGRIGSSAATAPTGSGRPAARGT